MFLNTAQEQCNCSDTERRRLEGAGTWLSRGVTSWDSVRQQAAARVHSCVSPHEIRQVLICAKCRCGALYKYICKQYFFSFFQLCVDIKNSSYKHTSVTSSVISQHVQNKQQTRAYCLTGLTSGQTGHMFQENSTKMPQKETKKHFCVISHPTPPSFLTPHSSSHLILYFF